MHMYMYITDLSIYIYLYIYLLPLRTSCCLQSSVYEMWKVTGRNCGGASALRLRWLRGPAADPAVFRSLLDYKHLHVWIGWGYILPMVIFMSGGSLMVVGRLLVIRATTSVADMNISLKIVFRNMMHHDVIQHH